MLKRLELLGFKSFSQKTILNFSKGITVIVGPNGSGKSNIIDAIRWLLGERDAKNVRGDKIEDLIFSGTSKKNRVSLAQASLYFDNTKKILPIDFNEVMIGRKIYRDGSSEYLINKAQVRLKDLIDFFAKSGMGARGLSVIGQGGSDAFVKALPQERREMMEEILGLRQYQIKKHEAELKLTNTRQNLEQASLTINELLPHLRLLRKQTEKWEKKAVFAKELTELENNFFSLKFRELKSGLTGLDPKISDLEKQLEQLQNEIGTLKSQMAKMEAGELKDQDNRRYKLERELGQLEAQLSFFSTDRELKISFAELFDLVKKIQQQIKRGIFLSNETDLRQLLANLDQEIDRLLNNNETKKDGEKLELEKKIVNLKKELAAVMEAENQKRDLIEDFKRKLHSFWEEINNKHAAIQRLESQKNQHLLEKNRWLYRQQDLHEKIKQIGRQPAEFQNVQLASAGNFDFLLAEQRMNKLRNELMLIGEIDQNLIKEAESAEERYQFLSSQTADLQKAVTDLEKLTQDLDSKIKSDFNNYLKMVNKELDNHFKILFGSGYARLIADENSIEIEAAVPNKGVKNIESLSGGEKSLLAIAVLFSLISVTPPPFLVFDEVDAALDDNNSRRFIELLKKFAEKTQFIIVTHNRAVMESADVLYGVTINKDGFSKLLSLTF